jgi:hypothetical protein
MSNKSLLFEALRTYPATLTDEVFPTLTIPATPSTVEDAIIAAAKAEIEVCKFLNTFKGIKIKELYGMVGMMSPSAQAIAGGLLQSDGSALSGTTVEDFVKILGSEADGGGLTGIYEDIARRDDTGENFGMYEAAVALVPALANYAPVIAPMIDLGIELFKKPGRIGEQVGLILFEEVCSFIRQVIINELYDDDDPAQVDSVALKRIADNMDEIAINSNNEGIVEVDGVRLWTHSHVVDDS